MAAPADTMGDEGGGEGGTEVSIGDWLAKHRLSKFKQKFIDDEIAMDDLLSWDEQYLSEMCKEYSMRPPFDKRLKSAVRALQFACSETETPQNASQRIYRVVTSTKECDSMKLLESKLSTVDGATQKNTNETSTALQDKQKIEDEIESTFGAIINAINERKKQLMGTLNDESNVILNGLKQQQNALSSYVTSIKQAQKQQNELLLDPNMDTTKRELKVIEITNNALQSIDDAVLSVDTPKMKYILDADAVHKSIANIGIVSSAAVPDPLVLNVTNITDSTADIELKAPNKDVLQYSLKYRAIDDDNDDEKSQNWKDILMSDDANVYSMTNLNVEAKYEVMGKYQSSNRLWSRDSKIHRFEMDKSSLIDLIKTTTDYPACDYNIPFVCKQRVDNEITLYLGFERFEVIQDNKIKIHLPYVYINDTKQWYRLYGGNKTNAGGIMAGKHLALIMNLQYEKICDDIDGGYVKRYSDDATNSLPQMYYRGGSDSVDKPTMSLTYQAKGSYGHDMPWIQFTSHKNKIRVQ
eukprot:589457_1